MAINKNYEPEVVIPDINAISHEQWLKSRKKGIGGSDAGTIFGVNRYSTPAEIALKKLSIIPDKPVDAEKQYILDFGHAMEKPLLNLYAAKTGYKVWEDHAQYRHPLYTFMLADCDGFAETIDGQKIGLEIKTYNYETKYAWKSGVYGEDGVVKNPEYAIQVAHYMAVMNLDRYDLIANCGNNPSDLTIVTFYRDEDFEEKLIEVEKEFWENVTKGIVPEVSTLTDTQFDRIVELISEPIDDEDAIDLPETSYETLEEISELDERKKSLKSEVDKIDERINGLKLPLIEQLGGHQKGVCKDYTVTFKSSQRESIDSEKLKINFPEQYELVKKISTTKPTFRYKKGVK